ncbi:hypothetical protein NQ315_009723 [Exocentrus adspersus]|uniref:Uncharacterized protein n=1 Tax=Exocentrus adspersus TaxID=1586481 RepID=A0AAV8WJE0_9CUCU|nr:hypothetical protein NQ315_009723 [Exocentrus adspersus]
MKKQDEDNRANQRNPNNPSYWKSRDMEKPKDWQAQAKGSSSMSKEEQDNRSRQKNPNNPAYYDSRGGKK